MKRKNIAVLLAIAAAALYAVNIPLSKILLRSVTPTMMAAFLYLGAGTGLVIVGLSKRVFHVKTQGKPLTKKELPYTVGMVVLDIAAPILLMLGISRTSPASVSLLNNFEIVATSLIALLVFKEPVSKRLWYAIGFVTLASVVLGVETGAEMTFDTGALFVIGACVCWGMENNCTKMISNKDASEIVIIKGICSGLGSLVIALLIGEKFPEIKYIALAMLLGFVAYGLSINCYILAQKDLGAAKTSAYYTVAPFIGAALSFIILGERPKAQFYFGLVLMIVGTVIMLKDSIELLHKHEHDHIHSHAHMHGDLVHTHSHIHHHEHQHIHGSGEGEHSHDHSETELSQHEHSHGAALM